MCKTERLLPANAGEAVALVEAGLDYLNRADIASLDTAVQAELLKALERAEAKHTAARVHVLAPFDANCGYSGDAQYSVKSWLTWQTRVTRGAAAGAVGWMKRIRGHHAVWEALAAGAVSASWARDICSWTGRLDEADRDDADRILLGAAAGGAAYFDLAALAWDIYQRSRAGRPDADDDDGFDDRGVWLLETFARTGRLNGDMTATATAALRTVLDSLAAKAGPEDTRTKAQREHDALEEACMRLIGSGMLPERAGQPVHLQLQITLDELVGSPGSPRPNGSGLTAALASALACDATIHPVITGRVDPVALDALADLVLAGRQERPQHTALAGQSPGVPLRLQSRDRVRETLLHLVTRILSGPGGLAAALRAHAAGRTFSTISLPLEIAQPTDTIPVHLRRAIITRARGRCEFPGCSQPAAACQVHHLVPSKDGGETSLPGCVLLCRFHHLIVIHRWGWKLTLHPDGTTTATSPGGRTLHSHGPPGQAA